MVVRMANNGREKTFVRLWHITLRSVLIVIPRFVNEKEKAEKSMYALRKVGTDTLLTILLSLIFGFLEDELRYVAIEVIVCDGTGDRCTHLRADKAGYYRGERAICHPGLL
jgi:hypothetical protein